MKSDHEVYIFDAGWKALPDGRCKIRKSGCKKDVIEVATMAGVKADHQNTDEGPYDDIDAQAHFRFADMPADAIEIKSLVDILQPYTGTDADWKQYRVRGFERVGGMVILDLATEFGEN